MSPFDHSGRPALTAAHIRALHDQSPSPEVTALAWEVWRLQRLLLVLDAGLRDAVRLQQRAQIVEHLESALALMANEPCFDEAKPVKPGRSRVPQPTPR